MTSSEKNVSAFQKETAQQTRIYRPQTNQGRPGRHQKAPEKREKTPDRDLKWVSASPDSSASEENKILTGSSRPVAGRAAPF
jgi:hypothetical protein